MRPWADEPRPSEAFHPAQLAARARGSPSKREARQNPPLPSGAWSKQTSHVYSRKVYRRLARMMKPSAAFRHFCLSGLAGEKSECESESRRRFVWARDSNQAVTCARAASTELYWLEQIATAKVKGRRRFVSLVTLTRSRVSVLRRQMSFAVCADHSNGRVHVHSVLRYAFSIVQLRVGAISVQRDLVVACS